MINTEIAVNCKILINVQISNVSTCLIQRTVKIVLISLFDVFTITYTVPLRWISLAIFPTLHSLAIRPIRIPSTTNPITRIAAKKLSKLWPRSLCDRQIIESRPVAEWHSTLYTFGVNDEPRHSQNSGGSSEPVRDIEQLQNIGDPVFDKAPDIDKDCLSRIWVIYYISSLYDIWELLNLIREKL